MLVPLVTDPDPLRVHLQRRRPSNGRIADVGRLAANNGALTYTYDENYNSNVSSGSQLTGTYTMGSSGRGTATLGNRNFVFYIVSSNQRSKWPPHFAPPANLAGTLYVNPRTFCLSITLAFP